jgi:2-methylcitrate dehydratase PrpD
MDARDRDTMTAIAALASFVTTAEVPLRAREAARAAVLDTLGVMLAGSAEPVARAVHGVVQGEDGTGRCRVVGTGMRIGSISAALANGTAAHAHDFDDMCWLSLAHPSAPLVAAGLAVAEQSDASGQQLLEAYCVGFEIETLLGRVMNPAHYEHGWHCTSTIGSIGAAAASVRLLTRDEQIARSALSIAASSASGLKASFGTMVKPLQAGLAARNGVMAAHLAAEGCRGSDDVLEHPQGFLRAMQSARPELAGTDELGLRWEILESGITVKLYPSCAATHPTIDTLLELKSRHRFAADDVVAVEIGVDPVVPTVLIHDRPTRALEGKFSLPYCAAAALAHGAVGLETFEPACLDDPAIQRLLALVKVRVDADLAEGGPPLTQARVAVRLADGRCLEQHARGARGYPDRPATTDDLEAKFLRCAARAVPADTARLALETVRVLDSAATVHALMELLAVKPAVAALIVG